jgi:3'-phosphoadenosine 5'-phosphosulfate sulfotransferase (PAPS reductase)/FAD synthetase
MPKPPTERISIAGVMPSTKVISTIARKTDTVLLAFSCGKDSIAAWLAIRKKFERIEPMFMYLIPGLEFVDEALDYYERFFGCHIHRVPHPSLYRMLRNMVFQPPEHCATVEAAALPQFDYEHVRSCLCVDLGLPAATWYATGIRAADSPIRRIAMLKSGPIVPHLAKFCPVWDWRKAEVVETLERAGCALPVDYDLFGRSFDGIDYRFLAPLKKHRPRDYARILEFFPLADLELFRAQCAGVA